MYTIQSKKYIWVRIAFYFVVANPVSQMLLSIRSAMSMESQTVSGRQAAFRVDEHKLDATTGADAERCGEKGIALGMYLAKVSKTRYRKHK